MSDVLPLGRIKNGATRLEDITTLGVGSTFLSLHECHTEEELIDVVRRADETGVRVLIIGGASNIVPSDDPFEGIIVRDMRQGIRVYSRGNMEKNDDDNICVDAGCGWDTFVAWSVEEGYSGLEALSGIPGTVGAAPVQNIGAYGCDVSQYIVSLRTYDRFARRVCDISAEELGFGYRTSILKESAREPLYFPSPRYIVLEVTFRLKKSFMSSPVMYGQLAEHLGIDKGQSCETRQVRDAVIHVRSSKGMVLDDDDRDTYSCGSFFTNPVITEEQAKALPENAPRYRYVKEGNDDVGAAAPEEGWVKTSAAWLIDHAGFPAGYQGQNGAALSSKHCLALTNQGGARAGDIRQLAAHIQEGVEKTFGVSLVPEPVML
ncbi:MAG: UDP-N-acetylmuramate dehydrogenase [Actinomycetaceae bacterium]|nr:UDP-N-acetylmuramate dehydrogenase [Actinomycetaceae bacterium]